MRRCVFVAPGHANVDVRVTRSIRLLGSTDWEIDVVWDATYPGHKSFREQGSVRHHYVEAIESADSSLKRFRRISDVTAEFSSKLSQRDLIYVHASGIEGLWIAQRARNANPMVKVVFDYHDSLPFELHYQLSKRGLSPLYRPIWPLYRILLRNLATSVNGLVSISDEQARQFEELTGKTLPTAVIPNFRHFESFDNVESRESQQGISKIIWVGQVMRGRDLGLLAKLCTTLEPPWNLEVHGNVIDQAAQDDVESDCGENCSFHGVYSGDKDLKSKISAGAIAVFLGWNDPSNSGINEISSPNKFYSYVNLEIPVIIARELTGLARDVVKFNAGAVLCNKDDFSNVVREIRNDYAARSEGVRRLKQHYQGMNLQQRLNALIDKIAP